MLSSVHLESIVMYVVNVYLLQVVADSNYLTSQNVSCQFADMFIHCWYSTSFVICVRSVARCSYDSEIHRYWLHCFYGCRQICLTGLYYPHCTQFMQTVHANIFHCLVPNAMPLYCSAIWLLPSTTVLSWPRVGCDVIFLL